MFDYAELAGDVHGIIAEFGARAVLIKVTGEYDTETQGIDTSEKTYTGLAVRSSYKINQIDGTLIQAGDVQLMLSVKNMQEPVPGDRILFDGTTYRVINCSPIKPATVTVAYDVQLRV